MDYKTMIERLYKCDCGAYRLVRTVTDEICSNKLLDELELENKRCHKCSQKLTVKDLCYMREL